MAVLAKNGDEKASKSKEQLVIVHSQRFTKGQWDFLTYMQELTGCPVPEYVRRLVEADRVVKEKKS